MNDKELRVHAVQLAVKALEGRAAESELIPLAQQIFEFIQGETK